MTQLLEKAGYKKLWFSVDRTSPQLQINTITTNSSLGKSTPVEDWGEAIDVSIFYGRGTELSQVEEWIVKERCRLIAILGMGGVGKTAFSVKLAEQVRDKFEYVIWRSLHLTPAEVTRVV
ncbi:hypothetical protein NUACC21_03320 [Scytonema sp. NUACC21]